MHERKVNVPSAAKRGDAGFTLIECVVTIGIMLVLGLTALVIFNRSHASFANSRQALLAAVNEARLHAANNAGDSNGAMLIIAADGPGSTLTILQGRPIPGLAAPTSLNLPPVSTDARVTVGQAAYANVSLAFAPSGHVDVIPQALAVGSGAIATPPGCATSGVTTIDVIITLGTQTETHELNCSTGMLQ